jgi:Tfp pilus assembly protein PilN
VRAVNLIPSDARRGGRSGAGLTLGPAYAVVAALGVAVLLVTVYVLTSNTISDRQAKVASLQVQVTQEQARAAQLSSYAEFARLAETRIATVREIAATRFDWHRALADLSKVVPANTSLQSLFGSVAPGAMVSSASGSAGGSGITAALRGDEAVPAFEMTGCTASQDDVARLISRLRLINGVTRVTLADSTKLEATQPSAASSAAAATSTTSSGCPGGTPKFDLVIFFTPLPGAGPTGVASAAAVSTPAATSPSPAIASPTPAATSPSPASASPTPAAASPSPTSTPTSGSGGTK